MTHRWIIASILLSFILSNTSCISRHRLRKHVSHLAQPEMAGRLAGTKEADLAAAYIAQQFTTLGLKPIKNTYFQRFPLTFRRKIIPGSNLSIRNISVSAVEQPKQFKLTPLLFSAASVAFGQAVYVGYGLEELEYGYSDYNAVDVKGKTAFITAFTPAEGPPEHPQRRLMTLFEKARLAESKGAAAVIFMPDNANDEGQDVFSLQTELEPLLIPVAWLNRAGSEAVFNAVDHSLASVEASIANTFQPHSFELPHFQVTVETCLEDEIVYTSNVIGCIEPKALQSEKSLIIGAHYDHVGRGEALNPERKSLEAIYPGADDNASGVAVLLELARYFKAHPPMRTRLLFIAFGAEEIGRLGSRYYVEHPVVALSETVAMVNLDMLGHFRNHSLGVQGTETSEGLKHVVERLIEANDFRLTTNVEGTSDHYIFAESGVPALFVTTGLHELYNTPKDTPASLYYKGLVLVTRWLRCFVRELQMSIENIDFDGKLSVTETGSCRLPGSLGVRLNKGYHGPGVQIIGVEEDGTGQQIVLLKGDVILKIAQKDITNFWDFVYAVELDWVDCPIELLVERGGKQVFLK